MFEPCRSRSRRAVLGAGFVIAVSGTNSTMAPIPRFERLGGFNARC